MTVDKLADAVVRTLVWFDISSYPLTAFECWRYLMVEGDVVLPVSLAQISRTLEELQSQKVVTQEHGFWQLADVFSRVPSRLRRGRWALAKRRRAEYGARVLAHIPWVKFVGLVNTLAFDAPRQFSSDVDFFIVVAPGRLYLGRLLVTLVLHMLRWRRHGVYVHNRLCLSFFISADHLNLQPLARTDDPYLKIWIASLVPLYDAQGFTKHFQAANTWVKHTLPNWLVESGSDAGMVRLGWWSRSVKMALERMLQWKLGDWLEQGVRRIQLSRILPFVHKRNDDSGTAVVVSKQVIKMHVNDRRAMLARTFQERLAHYQQLKGL